MNLKEQTIRAFLWLTSASYISLSFSWIVTILLARLLLPADFGLIAMAALFIGLLDLINEMGIGAAIIQKKDLKENDLHSTFWFSILFGLILYMFIFILAPIIGIFFGSEKLAIILRILGISFIIGSFKIVPFHLLTKELAFDKRSKAEFSSIILGGLMSLVLAIKGYGVWSLVCGSLLKNLVMVVLINHYCPWKPKPVFLFENMKKILNFSIPVVSSHILWHFGTNSDVLIIGKVLGDKWLGYYSMALGLATLPIQRITGIVNQVSFPVFSKLQSDKKKLQVYFLKITKFTSLITFPCLVGLFLVSESLIEVVLTEKWLPMLIPFKFLCIMGLFRSVGSIIPPLLIAMGKTNIVLKFNMISLITMISSFLIGINFGINGVAFAWLMVYPCLMTYLYWHGLKKLDITVSGYLRNLVPSIAASTFMILIVLLFQFGGGAIHNENIYLRLIGSCTIGTISYFAYLLLYHRDIITEILGIFSSLDILKPSKEFALK
jgi:teichuronic acid exporter